MNLQLSNEEIFLKQLTVESNLEGFRSVQELSKEIGRYSFNDGDRFKEYLLCIDEVFCNCISHAYQKACGKIHVEFYLNDEYLKVSIKDFGIGIPIEYTKEIPRLSSDLLAESGRGLIIVNSMCDKLIIKRNEDSGTEVIIYFKKGW